MKTKEIYEALARLTATTQQMQEALIESEGEVTPEVEDLEAQQADIRQLLTEGIDSLGDWLAAKEGERDRRKAELAHCRRKIAACERTIDYIKGLVESTLALMGEDKVKGEYYGFARRISRTTAVNKDAVNELFNEAAREAFDRVGIPPFITFTLGASSTTAKTAGMLEDFPTIFEQREAPAVTFTKPRGGRSDE